MPQRRRAVNEHSGSQVAEYGLGAGKRCCTGRHGEIEMKLTKEDLFVECERCDGTGEINESFEAVPGSGIIDIMEGDCPDCEGRGAILTESGKAIEALLRVLRR